MSGLTGYCSAAPGHEWHGPYHERESGFPGADDMGNMFQFKRDFNDDFRGARNVEFARTLNP